MISLWGNAQKYCDGLNRRSFLKLGAFGTGLSLSGILRARALGGEASSASTKSAIMIYLGGGPSHMDMYDLKPESPMEFRGEFKPIQTNVAGVQICEHFPMQARMWDKLSVVRSVVGDHEHSDSTVSTGYSEAKNKTAHHPSFGSVMSKLRSGQANDIPPFVSLRGNSPGLEPGYLGIAHRAYSSEGQGISNLRLPGGVNTDRVEERKGLLSRFDSIRRDIDDSGTMSGLDSFTTRAFDMVASGTVRKALDLSHEDPRSRDRYRGVEQFLMARRLVEAGVGCITLGYGGWDTHENNFPQLRKQLPELDRGIANLIQDLHDRGMENDVVTVCWGEFGRSPKINNGGRDHWPAVMSAMVAGGGLKMGQAVGTTNARGEVPKDRPYQISNVLATLYGAVGIDPSIQFKDNTGRPNALLDERDPVAELV